MATGDLDEATVEMVRLAPGVSKEDFERALGAAAPRLVGSLLTWLHDDWYALAPDVSAALERQGGQARAALQQAGARSWERVAARSFTELALMRDSQQRPRLAPARARARAAGLLIEPPVFSRPGQYQGRPVRLDWHVAAVGLPRAWQLLGDAGPGAYAQLKVGHIDTGYTEHPALGWTTPGGSWLLARRGRNYWKEKAEGPVVEEGPPSHWHEVPEHDGPRDNLTGGNGGHGTRTMSLLGGLWAPADGSTAHPYFGAAPGVPIIPYRITDSVFIDHVPDLLTAAIDDAVAQGVSVISISLGALRRSRRVARAVTAAYRRGVIVCAAAGNVIREVIYPGRLDCVITVGGATTSDGFDLHPWAGASRGPAVDISGPADRIRRATTVLRRGREEFEISGPGDGTSFATAQCAGIAVLWLARRGPELDAAYGDRRWARVEAFRTLLRQTAQVPPGWDTQDYGAGVYQADALLDAPLPPLDSLQERADED